MVLNFFLKIIFFIFLCLLIITNSICANQAIETSRGSCNAWFSIDAINWQNTTTYSVLALDQPFYIKIWVKAKQNLTDMSYHGTCYGPPYDFELIGNLTELPENAEVYKLENGRYLMDIGFKNPKSGEENTIIWICKVKKNASFVNGTTPVNLDVQFTKNGHNNSCFTLVSIHINDSIWINQKNPIFNNTFDKTKTKKIVGFDIIIFFTTIFILIIFKRCKTSQFLKKK